jgi:hypothetical protein
MCTLSINPGTTKPGLLSWKSEDISTAWNYVKGAWFSFAKQQCRCFRENTLRNSVARRASSSRVCGGSGMPYWDFHLVSLAHAFKYYHPSLWLTRCASSSCSSLSCLMLLQSIPCYRRLGEGDICSGLGCMSRSNVS